MLTFYNSVSKDGASLEADRERVCEMAGGTIGRHGQNSYHIERRRNEFPCISCRNMANASILRINGMLVFVERLGIFDDPICLNIMLEKNGRLRLTAYL